MNAPARFPRRARLLRPDEFKTVFAGGKRESAPLFTVIVLRNELQHARLGLAVARKTIRHAVMRNRVKRHIRESFRQNQHRLPPVDLVFLPRTAAQDAAAATLRQQLQRLWTRIAEQWPTH
ncbi:MAG: ribonuclease P protein component [Rhodanobacteraceae bacterium]